ncbi:MAG: hypothetical protein ABSD76_11230 [Terriglobales bacterium]|jgi:hypothetical protein
MGCILCGGSPSVRSEQVHVSDETKNKLLAHADKLKTYGVIVEEQRTFRKVAGALEAFGVGLVVADSLNSGVLRKLVLYLRNLAIPEDQILRLRLDEPETISKLLNNNKATKKTKSAKKTKGTKKTTGKTRTTKKAKRTR